MTTATAREEAAKCDLEYRFQSLHIIAAAFNDIHITITTSTAHSSHANDSVSIVWRSS
jgi:hypothetical protein